MFRLEWRGLFALVRIFGRNTELYVNREIEMSFMRQVGGKLDFISRLYGTFSNGFCYEFFPGKALTGNQQVLERIESIAETLSSLHKEKPVFERNLTLWSYIERVLNQLSESDFEGINFSRQTLFEIFNQLRETLEEKYANNIVISHNDLHSGNILQEGFVKFHFSHIS